MNHPGAVRRNDPCPCGSGKKFKACCAVLNAPPKTSVPADVPAMLVKARQAVARRDPESTEFWFRQILAVRPRHPEALAGLGQKLCWDDRRSEGLAYLGQAAEAVEKAAAKTRDIEILLQLAAQLHHWGDMEVALRLARHAVRLVPRSAAAHNALALYLSRVNRVDEALPHAIEACRLMPDSPACNMLLAQLDARQGRSQDARARLERVVVADRSAEHTARSWMELGAVLDKMGEYDGAFAAFGKGTERLQALPAFQAVDAGSIFRNIELAKSGYDRALLRRWTREELDDGLPGPVFLLGFLRSGTTLTEQILGAHPEVLTSDENGLIHELRNEVERQTGCGENIASGLRRIGVEAARALRARYWSRVVQEYGSEARERVFVDKVALNTLEIGLISALFPDSLILFALRDPRDVCLSCFTQAFNPSPVTVNLLSWQGVARQYAAVMDLWLHFRADIAPRYIELRYESTVSNFEATYRRVFDFLGIEWTSDVLRFHENVRGRYIATPSFDAVSRPLYSSSAARWRRYARYFEPIRPELERFVTAFGYAPFAERGQHRDSAVEAAADASADSIPR